MAERTVTITSPDLDGSGTPGPIELAITEAGEGGRPLLLLHGFGGRRHDFEDHVEDLAAAGWHVVAPDHRGHGDSDDPAGEDAYTIEILAADALVLADELGWDRFVLLGHSMGGMVAQVIALDAPDRLEGLVLMNTSHGPIPMDENLIATAVAICRTQGIDALADAVAALGPDGPLTTPAHRRVVEERPGYAERGIDNLRACSPEMYAAFAQAITTAEDRLHLLDAIDVDTLVLVGDQDQPFLEPSRSMAETIPSARLVVIPDAGHSPQFEAPEQWYGALSEFLDTFVGVG